MFFERNLHDLRFLCMKQKFKGKSCQFQFFPLTAGALLSPLLVVSHSYAQAQFELLNGIEPVTDAFQATGCGFGDFDNDGFVDLFVGNFSGSNRLYRNNHDNTFSLVEGAIFLGVSSAQSYGISWVDYDNDGNLDIFVANGYGTATSNFLYRNQGDGTFADAATGSLLSTSGHYAGCGWADYDRDGFVDLFVTSGGGVLSWLYRNDGQGRFVAKVGSPSVVSDAVGAAWADFNNDGWPDLFVANGFGDSPSVNFLYQNNQNGGFKRVVQPQFKSATHQSVGVTWGDYDNDGFLDAFVPNNGSWNGVRANREVNELYHNEQNGTLRQVTDSKTGPIVTDRGNSISACWADYDNDGWLDLVVGNRTYDYNDPETTALYHNNGDGTFSRVDSGPIAEYVGSNGGCAWGDIDNDGFLDLFLTSLSNLGGQNALFHNLGNANHWLKFRCVGTVSNRSAIGTKVRVHAQINGKSFWQLREISTGDGLGNPGLMAHFGLGDAAQVDAIRIEWPSGIVQELGATEANQMLTLVEPARLNLTSTQDSLKMTIQGGRGMTYAVEESGDLKQWSKIGSVNVTEINGLAAFETKSAQDGKKHFFRTQLE